MQIQEEKIIDADGTDLDLEQAAAAKNMASAPPGPATNAGGEEEEAEDDQTTADAADSQLQAFAGRINELCDEMQELAASISKIKGGSKIEGGRGGIGTPELASHVVSQQVSYLRWMVAACLGQTIPGDDDEEDEESSDGEEQGASAAAVDAEEDTEVVDEEAEALADCHYNGKSLTELEEEEFARHREGWEAVWGKGSCNTFENFTLLSSMLFTHVAPGCIPDEADLGRTFQIYSIKVTELKGFMWPLKVYGMVAARDEVDRRRNALFLRPRGDCQILTPKDPFLHLTGPCRAIMSEGRIDIEIQLRVKRGKKSEDRSLISRICSFDGENGDDLRSCLIDNHFCTMKLSYEKLEKSVQATIFGVQVVDWEAPSPFGYGVKSCLLLPA